MKADIKDLKSFMNYHKYYSRIAKELIVWVCQEDASRLKVLLRLRLADKYEELYRESRDLDYEWDYDSLNEIYYVWGGLE